MKITLQEGKHKITIKGFDPIGIIIKVDPDGKILIKDAQQPNSISVEYRSIKDRGKEVINLGRKTKK